MRYCTCFTPVFGIKVLHDLGLTSCREPFYKLVNQGLILGEDGQKMSKSRGGMWSIRMTLSVLMAPMPFGCMRCSWDLLRCPSHGTPREWRVYRFLGRVWRLFVDEASEVAFEQALSIDASKGEEHLACLQRHKGISDDAEPTAEQLKSLHQCIKKVTDDLEGMRFNTAISAMMVLSMRRLPGTYDLPLPSAPFWCCFIPSLRIWQKNSMPCLATILNRSWLMNLGLLMRNPTSRRPRCPFRCKSMAS